MSVNIRGMAPLLQVFDMPTAIHFYRDVLGFKVNATSQPDRGDDVGWAGLSFKGTEIMLNTAYDEGERPPKPDAARVAAHGDTCLYFGCEELDEAYQHLIAHGVRARPAQVAPYGMRQLYTQDPDGYGVCFQWPASQEMHDRWVADYGIKPKTVG
jgi:glyoxylase I family protein